MNFETMDWDAELIRTIRAFGLEGRCEWFKYGGAQYLTLVDNDEIDFEYGGYLMCFGYMDEGLYIMKNNEFMDDKFDYSTGASLTLGYDGKRISGHQEKNFGIPMAQALFHLGFLTPELEAVLGVAISHHKKLEWELEYEQLYEL